MSYVTVLLSVAGAAALLLGIVHSLVWLHDRQAGANLSFAFVSLAVVGIAVAELGMMHSRTAAEWAAWVRWCHVPIFILFCGILLFIKSYLGTGRSWLMWAIIVGRGAILVWNFSSDSSFNFDRVASIDRISFLGEQVTVVGAATPNPLQWLATATAVLCFGFVVDAAITLWRRQPEARRGAIVIGVGAGVSVSIAVVYTQLVIWGVLHWPMLITPAFIALLAAMAYELSRDLLNAKRLARELSSSERRFELAAVAASLGLWTWDPQRNQVWATNRARAMLGFEKGEPIGLYRLIRRTHADDVGLLRNALRQALATESEQAVEFRVRLPSGATRWIAARGSADRTVPNGPPLLRGVLRDVTDQRNTRDEADELRRELAHAGRVTMLGQLASALAHELKQPLGAILRNTEAAQLLLESEFPDLSELREMIRDIHADDRRAGEVIDRLRALLRRRQIELQPIAVASLIKDVNSLVRVDAAARNVALECSIATALPHISGDKVHLSQVLINLILNGMDATGESSESRRRVIVTARAKLNSLVEISVTDSGPGIAPAIMSRIFEPFFTTKASGMGMGLCVSRSIIEAHGGRIWAENNVDGGATFRIALPAAEGAVA